MIILLTIPGLILLSFLKEQYRESILNKGKWTFIIGTSVVITTLLSVVLLLLRSFNVYTIMSLYMAAGLSRLLWLFSKGKRLTIKKLLPDLRSSWALVIVLLIAGILYFQPTEYYVGGRDPGVYVNAAVYMAKAGQIMKKDPLIDQVKEDYSDVFEIDTHKYAGFYIENRGGQTWVNPQFYHGYTAWLALGYQWLGSNYFLYITPLLGLISIMVMYRAVSELINERAGFITAALLAINISQIWYARGPYTEILSQLLLWLSVYLLIKAQEFKNPLLAAVAGLAIGAAILVRLDNILILLPLGLYLVYNYLGDDQSYKTWIKYIIGSLALCAFIFFIYVYQYGKEYTHFQLIRETPIPDGLSLSMLFTILGAIALAGMFLIWLLRERLYRWLSCFERHQNWFKALLGIIAIAAFVYLYLIRPYSPNVHIDGELRSFREESLVRIGWYISPLGLVLCLGGFLLFVLKKASQKHLFFILLVLLNFSLFLYDPNIYPEHFWAVRRHVPFIIPAMLIFAAVVIEQLISLRQKLIKAVGLGLVLLLVANFGLAARPFIFHTEHGGVGKQLAELAERFDKDDIILTVDPNYASRLVGTPLDLIYGKNVLPLREDYNKEGLKQFLRDKEEQGYDIYFIITPLDLDMLDGIAYKDKTVVEIKSYIARPSLNQIPTKLMENNWTFEIIQWKEL